MLGLHFYICFTTLHDSKAHYLYYCMNRKAFLQQAATAGLALTTLPANAHNISQWYQSLVTTASPNWKGFNLLEKFSHMYPAQKSKFLESDIALIASWGFNFVRLPCSYLCWMKQEDWYGKETPTITNEQAIKDIDAVIELGKQYNLHVNLNMHRIQGYCVNPPNEPVSLWNNEAALKAAIWQWQFFADRYKDIDNKRLSFDLINEPSNVDETTYTKVLDALVDGIRAKDPNRLIVIDGLDFGTKPLMMLKDKTIIQSTRGYNPMYVSHYKAGWVIGSNTYPKPQWPITVHNETWNKETLQQKYIEPWKIAEQAGVGVHVGEWGCFNYTPHNVALRWMEDCLSLWKQAGWGWALWNLQGSFGVVNSERKDVKYEKYKGMKLDRKMLELLKRY
jgi:endoglucanase